MNKLRALLTSTLPFLSACDSRVIDVPIQKDSVMNIYDQDLTNLRGGTVAEDTFSGKVTLIVNLASKCGLTPQYGDLQALYERYASQGFSVVGFPCNDFGGQEPGDADVIAACAAGYSASFPIMEKVSVVEGDAQCAMYRDLQKETGALPEWNFGKYLIDKNGTPIAFFGSRVEPLSPEITDRIDALLQSTE